MKKTLINIINFKSIGDERGNLIALEKNKNIPFEIKRVYYLFDTKDDVVRGYHAHKKLKQVLICIAGSCRIKLDDGDTQEYVILNDKTKGLHIDSFIWREMDEFSNDCVLMTLANKLYDKKDYIRDYDKFLGNV